MLTATIVDMGDIYFCDFQAAKSLAAKYGGSYFPSTTTRKPHARKIGPGFVFENRQSAEVFVSEARLLSKQGK